MRISRSRAALQASFFSPSYVILISIPYSMEVPPEMYIKCFSDIASFFCAKCHPERETGELLDIALAGVWPDPKLKKSLCSNFQV